MPPHAVKTYDSRACKALAVCKRPSGPRPPERHTVRAAAPQRLLVEVGVGVGGHAGGAGPRAHGAGVAAALRRAPQRLRLLHPVFCGAGRSPGWEGGGRGTGTRCMCLSKALNCERSECAPRSRARQLLHPGLHAPLSQRGTPAEATIRILSEARRALATRGRHPPSASNSYSRAALSSVPRWRSSARRRSRGYVTCSPLYTNAQNAQGTGEGGGGQDGGARLGGGGGRSCGGGTLAEAD